MTTRPLTLRGPQVRAALAGRLSAVIVPLKVQPDTMRYCENCGLHYGEYLACEESDCGPLSEPKLLQHTVKLPFEPGDVLVCKETWAPLDALMHCDPGPQALADRCFYLADYSTVEGEIERWRSPVTMPRWASRLTLIVGDVQLLRVQDVSEEQAAALGVPYIDEHDVARCAPLDLWPSQWRADHPKPPHDWDSNPWCALAGVTVRQGNVDALGAAE